MKKTISLALLTVALFIPSVATSQTPPANSKPLNTVGNPYLPLWEHIPDGEPYVFDDPDIPGHQRVYIYGSHDTRINDYCGRDLVVWSAPVDSLNRWRYDGVILRVERDIDGKPLNANRLGDVLFAPDVALVTAKDGTKTYYLYPNDQAEGRQTIIAKSNRPDGPFEVCNWSKADKRKSDGVLRFDPAVLVDGDGRVYGYWGFQQSFGAELDPTTMCTVKSGTKAIPDMVSSTKSKDVFRFFEASSIRKIKDKYVFIYSRWTKDGEFGMPSTNYTLAYAYSDHPLGPWTYGGTIIDGRGRETNEKGQKIASATVTGNTHGSICKIGNQWYVFYHRQTGLNEFSRQPMVAPITVDVEEGKGGKVTISEGEYNSNGFALDGLDPFERHSAGIACWYTGPKTAVHKWPNKIFYGSYVAAGYGTPSKYDAPYDSINNSNSVVFNTDGSIVGYKYFNFGKRVKKASGTKKDASLRLSLNLIPEGIDGTITVMADRPWTSQGGKIIGTLNLASDMPHEATEKEIDLKPLTGTHAIYLVFSSPTKGKSICTLNSLLFR